MIQDDFSNLILTKQNLSYTNATCLTAGQDKGNKKGKKAKTFIPNC